MRQAAEREAWSIPTDQPQPEAPIRWHPSLGHIRSKAAEGAKSAARLKKISDWEAERSGRQHPDRQRYNVYGSWQHFADKGQLAIASHKKCVIRVSVLHWERAVALLNRLAWLAAEKGLIVSMIENQQRLELKRGKACVELRVAERFDSTARKELRSWSKTWESVKVAVPTGRLSIFIEGVALAQTVVSDRPQSFLEGRISEIWEGINDRLDASAEKQLEWELWEKERQEAARLREEQELREQERRRLEAEESARRSSLLAEAEAWNRTRVLRAYLRALDRRNTTGGIAAADYERWRTWATSVATALDPSERRVGYVK